MNSELLAVLEYIEQERGIRRETMIDALEKALLSASKKSIHPAEELEVKIDPETCDIRAWANLEAVDNLPNSDQILIDRVKEKIPDAEVGDKIKWEVTPSNFGRIAAQTAKQSIIQQLRMAEKANVKEEFEDRIGQIINGTVRRFDPTTGSIITDMQKAEGIISQRDRLPREKYMPGDMINALLIKVETQGSGPSLILSRTNENFLQRLFEREVSEIHDGIVEIIKIVREPGFRAKVAVKSNDEKIDAVGACVGMSGMRVKAIMSELGGERIDIIPYSEDLKRYAENSLLPAKLKSVQIDEEKKIVNVYVDESQSKQAFGKKAQNIRLAKRLLDMNINIIVDKDTEAESIEDKMVNAADTLHEDLEIDEETANKLVHHGFLSVDVLKSADKKDIEAIEGLNKNEAETVLKALDNVE